MIFKLLIFLWWTQKWSLYVSVLFTKMLLWSPTSQQSKYREKSVNKIMGRYQHFSKFLPGTPNVSILTDYLHIILLKGTIRAVKQCYLSRISITNWFNSVSGEGHVYYVLIQSRLINIFHYETGLEIMRIHQILKTFLMFENLRV